jgi:nucleotidyltransferase/DNA polymerase involved in DNA repair
VVKPEEVKDFLFPMKAGKIPGVGPKTEHALKELNIETIKDLASLTPEILTRLFGTSGARLNDAANGIDNDEVVEGYETKSIGRDVTLRRMSMTKTKYSLPWMSLQRKSTPMFSQMASSSKQSQLESGMRISIHIPAPNPFCLPQMTLISLRTMLKD